jgi:iron complex transport system substrate-binding protein
MLLSFEYSQFEYSLIETGDPMRQIKFFIPLIVLSMILAACAPAATAVPTEVPVVPTTAPVSPTDVPATAAPAPTEAPTEAPAAAASSYTVTDALGRTLTFKEIPSRIVITGKALFMLADAVFMFPDASSRVIAMGSPNQNTGNFLKDFDSTYASKTILASDAGADQIAALKPDLVILKSYLADTTGKPIEALGVPVLYLDFETPDQYTRDIDILGQLFQNPDRAKEISTYFTDQLTKVTTPLKDLKDDQKPKTLLLYYNNKDNAITFNVAPASYIQYTMTENAGGQVVWKDANPGKGWAVVTIEQIAAWDPDQIYIIAYFQNVGEVVKGLKADAQWQGLTAVKNNQLYGFAGDYFSWDEADPRWILGQTWLAAMIHPDLYKDLDMKKEAATFYQTLYNVDEATFNSKILPKFTGDIH